MKYLVTPEFSKKLAVINADARADVSRAITRISALSPGDLSVAPFGSFVQALGGDIYILREGSVRIVATTVPSDDQTALLLLDLIENKIDLSRGTVYASRDPRTNAKLNPRLNSGLNPQLNSLINPKLNAQINPKLNASINPRLNSQINPKLNGLINPKLNVLINPNYNTPLNPRYNGSINPKLNRAYGGPFIYDLNLNQSNFMVRASDNIILIFDMDGSFVSFGVKNVARGYTLFNTDNSWIGHMVSANNDVFLVFDLDNDRTGIMV